MNLSQKVKELRLKAIQAQVSKKWRGMSMLLIYKSHNIKVLLCVKNKTTAIERKTLQTGL
jgi:hypothetical protein